MADRPTGRTLSSAICRPEPQSGGKTLAQDVRVCVRTQTPKHKRQANHNSEPRSGARIQPRAEALDASGIGSGVRTVLTETRKSWVSVNQTESWVSVNQTESCESRRDGTTTWPQLSIRIKVLFAHALAPLQHTFRENRRLPAATGQPSPHVCLRSHRVRLRPYRQLPHLYRR